MGAVSIVPCGCGLNLVGCGTFVVGLARNAESAEQLFAPQSARDDNCRFLSEKPFKC
jgi:hypothetical protein